MIRSQNCVWLARYKTKYYDLILRHLVVDERTDEGQPNKVSLRSFSDVRNSLFFSVTGRDTEDEDSRSEFV